MNVKQFLYSIRDEQSELELSLLPGAIRYDKERVSSSPTDQMSEKMASVVDYKTDLEKKLAHLNQRKKKK